MCGTEPGESCALSGRGAGWHVFPGLKPRAKSGCPFGTNPRAESGYPFGASPQTFLARREHDAFALSPYFFLVSICASLRSRRRAVSGRSVGVRKAGGLSPNEILGYYSLP